MMIKNYFMKFLNKRDTEKDIEATKEILTTMQKNELEVTEEVLNFVMELVQYYLKNNKQKNIKILMMHCHIISNLSLNQDYAIYLIDRGLIQILTKILKQHKLNCGLVWKCTSALWNLCQPMNTAQFIPNELPTLVFDCLIQHSNSTKAVHTCLGCLSNLALSHTGATLDVITSKNMNKLLPIIRAHQEISKITGHFGALIANIAVENEVAEMFVHHDVVEALICCCTYTSDRECIKHLIAAVHNISDVKMFPYHLCDCRGVEVLRVLQSEFDQEIFTLIDGIFNLASMPTSAATSLHVSVVCCNMLSNIEIIKKFGDLEAIDLDGKTPLKLAIEHKKCEIVELLLASGARMQENVYEDMDIEEDEKICHSISKGKLLRMRSKKEFNKIVCATCPKANNDICSIVSDCIPGVDLLLVLSK